MASEIPPPLCVHQVPCLLRVSRSAKNPGRSFYCCTRPYKSPNNCGYFCWLDEHEEAVRAGTRLCPAVDPPKPVRPPPHYASPITEAEFIAKIQSITPEEIEEIRTIDQRSEKWHAARTHRITASNFGSAAGHCKYKPPPELVRDMLWKVFEGNAMTEYGTKNEEHAFNAYHQHMLRQQRQQGGVVGWRSREVGLHIHPEHKWLGVSPDGLIDVLQEDGSWRRHLIEIKCPYTRKDRKRGSKDPFYKLENLPGGLRLPIPPYYFDQMQGVMGALHLPFAHFVVWTPEEMQITHVPFLPHYWRDELFPAMESFYFQQYVPAAVRQANGQLLPGDIA